jgi:2-phosphoxylose phosphatase
MHRHHKRTPYAANSFPVESYTWDCDDQGLYYFARPFSANPSSPDPNAGRNASALAYWSGFSGFNPFGTIAPGFKGSCQFPQITAQGLDDSWQHGADLYGAYHDLLGFLPDRDDEQQAWRQKVKYRVTNNVITSEVAGMVIHGMWRTEGSVPLLIQPSGVDSLEPSYTCSSAASQFSKLASAANQDWAAHFDMTKGLYATLDGISGVAASDQGFHKSFDHYYDNLSARQCHGKPLPCSINDTSSCVTQDLADEVYRLGHWEYSHTYRGAGPDALAASASSLGVWVAELAAHLRGVVDGGGGGDEDGDRTLWFHNVAHDGSVSRLLGLLQADVMVWPGMGSEVVFELWAKEGGAAGHFVRVLFGGRVLVSSNPSLGTLDMIPVETLLA